MSFQLRRTSSAKAGGLSDLQGPYTGEKRIRSSPVIRCDFCIIFKILCSLHNPGTWFHDRVPFSFSANVVSWNHREGTGKDKDP